MPPEPIVVMLIVVLGCAAFFFGVIYAVIRVLAAIANSVLGLFRPARRRLPPGRARRHGPVLVCPRPQCRRVERRAARYCSQCGARLLLEREERRVG